MNADFFNAYHRHLNDADLLFCGQRWANADLLYGYAAECGLKSLMRNFGMPVDPKGHPNQQEHRQHINALWGEYEALRSGHPSSVKYALAAHNPFAGWHVSNRYAADSQFQQNLVEPHQAAARKIEALLSDAQQDGLNV